MMLKLFLSAILLTLPSFIVSDSIVINNWDVSDYEYIDDDSNQTEYKAIVYLGENVTWSYDGSTKNIVQFDDDDAFENCTISNATVVDTSGSYIFDSWSEGKGNYYFASGIGTDCEDGDKIKLKVKVKQFEGNKKRKTCEGIDGATATVVTGGPIRSYGRCMKKCRRTRNCFGFQWTLQRTKARKWIKTKTCTLYDVYPDATGAKTGYKRAACMRVKYNNTDDS
jgi:hypothetical protein